MTGYRCRHDVDTISSTLRCRRCKRCKREMTGCRCLHDVDTISSISRFDNVNDVNEIWQGTDVYTISTRYRQHRGVDDVNDVNEVWHGTDVYTISTRYRQHRVVDDVNDINEVWQGTDVYTMSIRYRQHRDFEVVNKVRQGTDVYMMTGFRCWHDIDTILSTSWCRRYRKIIVNWTYLDIWPPKSKGSILSSWSTCVPSLTKSMQRFILYRVHKFHPRTDGRKDGRSEQQQSYYVPTAKRCTGIIRADIP